MKFKINIDYFNDRLLNIHNNDEITYIGKYGEDLSFTYLKDINKYIFWSYSLFMPEIKIDEEDKLKILTEFCFFGNNNGYDFSSTYHPITFYRINNSYRMTKKFYNKYIETNDNKYLYLLLKEIYFIYKYDLSKKEFNNLIIEGFNRGKDEVTKEEKKIFLLFRKIVKKQIKKNGYLNFDEIDFNKINERKNINNESN